MTSVTFQLNVWIDAHGDCDIEVTGDFEADDPGNGLDDPGSGGCFEATEFHYIKNSGSGDGTCDEHLTAWVAASDQVLYLAAQSQLEWESTP
jgi:hypothetical protein